MNKHINQNYDLYNGDKWDNCRLGDIINEVILFVGTRYEQNY